MKERTLLAVTCAAIVSAVISPAVAQPRSAAYGGGDASPVLEEVVVTADRRDSYSADLVQAGSFRGARQLEVPLTVNVIPDALMRTQQARGLLDALRNVAGVSPAQTSVTVYSNVAIRGIDVENRSNYRLNGILPIVNLVDLPLENKDRVEVLKGASALYYGFTTPAGIVNLTMKRPTPDPYLAAAVFGNAYGAGGGHVDAGDTWGAFGARINALYDRVDPGIDHSRGHRSLLSAAIDVRPLDAVSFTLDAEHIEKEVNEPGVFRYLRTPAPTITDPYPALLLPPLLDPTANFGPDWASNEAEERNALATLDWKMSPSWALSASYGNSHVVRDRHFNTLDLDTYGPGSTGEGRLSIALQPDATFENSSYRAEIAGVLQLWSVKHQLLLGATKNVRNAFASRSTAATCPGATPDAPRVPCTQNAFEPVDIAETPLPPRTGTRTRIDDAGYYFFDRIELASWLQLLAGVRVVDYEERNLDTASIAFKDEPTAVSYGAIVKPRRWLSVYGTYIEGLESTPPAPVLASNSGALLPATDSTQREAGIKLELRPGLLLQAAYFDIERDSAFVNAANLYVLDGRARYRGGELSVTGELTPSWSLYATAQSLDAKQISGAETRVTINPSTGQVTVVPTIVSLKIENTPESTVSVASEYRLTGRFAGFSVNGAAYYIGERAINALNQAFIPGYTLFDLGAAHTGAFLGRETTIRVSGQNVANRKYFSCTGASIVAQGPPRQVKFSITARF